MTLINLRVFYPWYTQDEVIEVTDEVAAELFTDKRYHRTHERIVRRFQVRSIDAKDRTEATASVQFTDSPAAIVERVERRCRLCQALNSLPEKQGRRVDAHYLLGMSRKEIAKAEDVSESAVNVAIEKGLAAIKKYLRNI